MSFGIISLFIAQSSPLISFMVQKPLLAPGTPGIFATLRTRCRSGNDAMTGDEDRELVPAKRGPHSAGGCAEAAEFGEFAVGDGFAEGDLHGLLPDTRLEVRSDECQGECVELPAALLEVLLELQEAEVEVRELCIVPSLLLDEGDVDDPLLRCGDFDRTDAGGVPGALEFEHASSIHPER